MRTKAINKDEITTSYWAGGESRQYYIYPETSTYAARDFSFRISMATSNTDALSNYTSLENIERHLIMLDGVAHVFHKDHYDIVMNPYKEIDVFDGGWESSASGKMTDFNLMLSKGCHGKMSVVDKSTMGTPEFNWLVFFCGYGNAAITLSSGEEYNLSQGDLIIFEGVDLDFKVNIHLEDAKLVRMDISC